MSRIKSPIKLICKESFTFNLTQPYEKFESGVTYNFTQIIRIIKNSPPDIWYQSDNSDYVDTQGNIFNLFYTQNELRDIKLTKILNKENDND